MYRSPHLDEPVQPRLVVDTSHLDEIVAAASRAQLPVQVELQGGRACRFRLRELPSETLSRGRCRAP